ncbi:AcrR family transcriptional regulator [Sporomusaceae bacterium BoRhaA]|uniref:TetR/AcrR family transcriptional regulator n=1 Tax=Pelorhabdus rhamnosifermentans TaxID=2772457 RepID=UPI001FE470EA|nr:TetR/AcrR family transcriptional regulator [Pelorhabdus rhamnosifermentans]MBU2699468.1 AcrR family transcriptional regulator [Pelorhabdus rhamnosifermentans]
MNDVKNFILDKAKERFDRFGYKKMTMDELSRDCGISKKTIYWHFYNKEDLFTELMLRESFKVRQILLDGIAEASDPLEKLIQLIKDAIAIFSEDSFLTRLFKADEILFSPFISRKYDYVIRAEINSIVSAIICEEKSRGSFVK